MSWLLTSIALASELVATAPTDEEQVYMECYQARFGSDMTGLMQREANGAGALGELATMMVETYTFRARTMIVHFYQTILPPTEIDQALRELNDIEDQLTAIGLQLVTRIEASTDARLSLLNMYGGKKPVHRKYRSGAADVCARDRRQTQLLVADVDPRIEALTERLETLMQNLDRRASAVP